MAAAKILGGSCVRFGIVAARSRATSASSCVIAASAQHAEIAGDNLEAGALLAFFVLPFARLDPAFDED